MMNRDNGFMADLMDATSRFFYAVLRVDLMKESVKILQSRDLLQNEYPEMPWEVYLDRYTGFVIEKDFEFCVRSIQMRENLFIRCKSCSCAHDHNFSENESENYH